MHGCVLSIDWRAFFCTFSFIFHTCDWFQCDYVTIMQRANVGWEACLGLLWMVTAGNRTPDLSIKGTEWRLYQLGHTTPFPIISFLSILSPIFMTIFLGYQLTLHKWCYLSKASIVDVTGFDKSHANHSGDNGLLTVEDIMICETECIMNN